MHHRIKAFASVVLVGASLGLAACGDDDDATTAAPSGGTTSTQATAKSGIEQSTIDVASKYVGVEPGKADESLPPFKVGFSNQQGGTPSFGEQQEIADATVAFINEHLGGVGGHPVELDKCVILSEEDGQKCGAQFLNDGIQIGNHGLSVVGNDSYFKTIKQKFPIIVSGQGGGADVTTKGVYLLDPGGVATVGGQAVIANKLGAKSVAVISSDNPAGKFAIEQLLNPAIKELGMTAKTVFVADSGTTPDYASALQAAGAAKADAVLSIPANVGACVSLFDAMKQLGIEKQTVATYTCYGDPFPEHAGDGLVNWYYAGTTNNPRIEADPQAQAYRNVMTEAGKQEFMFRGTGVKEFQDLLLITRFANELGFDSVTGEAMDEKIRTYRGPGFLVPGNLKCDGKTPGQPGVCGTVGGSSTWKDGAFVAFPTS